jgi:hypothetical protein
VKITFSNFSYLKNNFLLLLIKGKNIKIGCGIDPSKTTNSSLVLLASGFNGINPSECAT